MDKKVSGILGLAYKGGQILIGESTLKGLQSGRVKLVILASDASSLTTKKWQDKCAFYQVAVLIYGTKEQLGQALGKGQISVLSLINQKLGQKIENLMKDGDIYGTK